jgi:hypothetical protein
MVPHEFCAGSNAEYPKVNNLGRDKQQNQPELESIMAIGYGADTFSTNVNSFLESIIYAGTGFPDMVSS